MTADTDVPFDPDDLTAEDLQLARLQVAHSRAQLLTDAIAKATQPEPWLSEADLCDAFVETYPRTLFALGRFWRCPHPLHRGDPQLPWQPLPETHLAAEVLALLQRHQSHGPAPSPRRLASVLSLLRLRLATVPPDEWDNPVGFLPLATHLLAFSDGEVWLHEPDRFVATTLPYDDVYGAEAPAWQAFLQSSLPEAAGFIQEFAGYCLGTDVHHELSLWLYGPPGSGKSTLLHGLQVLLGPRSGVLALHDLARRRLDPGFLSGKTLLISDEPPLEPATVGLLNALVSGEPFTLAPAHGESVTLRSQAKLAVAFSRWPALDNRFGSLFRRAALVLCRGLAPGAHDPDLKHRISQEAPGLLNWAIAGRRRLYRRGRFDPPQTMLALSASLRLASTSPAAFIEECCLTAPDARTQATVLHQAYVAWCRGLGIQPTSANALAAEWRRHGFDRHRIKGLSYWFGVSLRPGAAVASALPAALPGPALPPVAGQP